MNAPGADLRYTPLHALHRELGAKFAPFAGFHMPIQFPDGILAEHRHTRSAAGLFDVSHMGQLRLRGAAMAAALERLVPVDVIGLPAGRQRYAVFTNEAGGVIDDFMVTNLGDELALVVNAARARDDIAHLTAGLAEDGALEVLRHHALLALQGPEACAVLCRLAPAAADLSFMAVAPMEVDGTACLVSRSGYTGEDGFEISLPAEAAEALARRLLVEPEVAPVGLGARDTLRLEAGLCLYGNELDEETTPVEAGLAWALSMARRPGGARPGGYPGADVIFQQLAGGPPRRRVGLSPEGRAPVRAGVKLRTEAGATAGRVTSGGYGPSVGGPVAMGYVTADLAEEGTRLAAEVRGKPVPLRVTRLPFVPLRYVRGASSKGARK